MAKKNRPKRFYDYSLLFCIIFLSVFGLVMIYSASSYTAQLKYNNAGYFMMRQLKIAAGGLVLALFISKLIITGMRNFPSSRICCLMC